MENDAATATHVSAGRPRDPEVNRRITQAALDLFGEAGWAGFAMEAVARRAGVGKASVYLRWSTKEALLTEAVTRRLTRVTDADTGTLRGDLTELAVQMLELYAGPDSQAVLRLHVEAAAIPGVAEHYAAVRRSQVLAARAIVRRGIRRGELGVGLGELTGVRSGIRLGELTVVRATGIGDGSRELLADRSSCFGHPRPFCSCLGHPCPFSR